MEYHMAVLRAECDGVHSASESDFDIFRTGLDDYFDSRRGFYDDDSYEDRAGSDDYHNNHFNGCTCYECHQNHVLRWGYDD